MTGGITPTDPNRNLYNGGSEWQNDFGDLPDLMQTYYRNYDQALGRWIGVDPDAQGLESLTPYNYSGNNPVMFNDPLGNNLVPMEGFKYLKRFSNVQDDYESASIEAWGGAGGYYTPGYVGYLKDQAKYANDQASNLKFWSALFTLGNQLPGDGSTFNSNAISQMYSPNGLTYWTQTGFAYYKPDNSIEAGVVKTKHNISFDGVNEGGDCCKTKSGNNGMATSEDYDLFGKVSFSAATIATALEKFDKSALGRFARVGRNANISLFVGGVFVDGLRWLTDPKFTTTKLLTNTGMGLIGFTKVGAPISFGYFGVDAFYPGGWSGFGNDANNKWQEIKYETLKGIGRYNSSPNW